jgi:hypothetical protein
MEDLTAREPLMAQVSIALFLFHLSYSQRRQYVIPPSLYRGNLKLGPLSPLEIVWTWRQHVRLLNESRLSQQMTWPCQLEDEQERLV